MILDVSGQKIDRVPVKGEFPGVGTRFEINGKMFRVVYVKHGKQGEYLRFTSEYCYDHE